jgi:LPXTG-motif cell wall-anchored protein
VLVLTGLVATSLAGGVAYAKATPSPSCVPGAATTYTNENVTRTDSGSHGDWATDTFRRDVIWSSDCKGTYTLQFIDKGTFATIPNASSPGTGKPLGPSFTGSFTGGALVTVKSDTPPHWPDKPAAGWPSTSEWPKIMFGGEPDVKMRSWGWSYAVACDGWNERWHNASLGNHGDVTNCKCPPKTTYTPPAPPTTTTRTSGTTTTTTATTTTTTTTPVTTPSNPPASATTSTTVAVHQAANGGSGRSSTPLAYTGASVGWLIALGGILLLVGASLVIWRVRRPQSDDDR